MNHRPIILNKKQIQKLINIPQVMQSVEEGFAIYSNGNATVPPFGSLRFENPPGDMHVKYGHVHGGSRYVVKVASGFYENPTLGIPSSQGLMLVFCSKTGRLQAILLDDAYLTDLRTAAAGAVAAKYFAPKNISCIGIIGTGTQALFQLNLLKEVTHCRNVRVWGRNQDHLHSFSTRKELQDFHITPTKDIKTLSEECNLIVTTTPAKEPLLFADNISPGTHITAVGADGGGKQELDPGLFARADRVCVDSREQCFAHGDASFAIKNGLIYPEEVVELGEVVLNPKLGRTDDGQITVVDLTGVAIQDIQIANAVLTCYQKGHL